jgi:hypothetical protein
MEDAKKLAGFGFTDEGIATTLEMTVGELRSRYGREIDNAKLRTNLAVLQTLLSMAKSGKHLGATTFWIKTHCSHLLPVQEVSETGTKKKKEYIWDPNDPNDRVIFSVYNNDGEPNADY